MSEDSALLVRAVGDEAPGPNPAGAGAGARGGARFAAAGKAGDGLTWVIDVAVVLALVAELAVVFSNVVTRTLFGTSYDWGQEVAEFALVFLTFVGGALAFRRGEHLCVHAGINAVPPRLRPYVLAASDAAVVVVAAILTQQSVDLVARGGLQRTLMLGLQVGWVRAPVAAGVALMGLFAFGKLFSYPPRVALPSVAAVVLSAGAVIYATQSAIPQDQALIVVLVAFALLLAMSTSIGFVFAAITLIYLQQTKAAALSVVPLTMQHGTSSFVMLAVPFFILAGTVMTEGGLAVPMSDAVASVVGRLRGGLLQVIVVGMYIFSGISGSKVADMVAVGTSLSTMLKREGYPKGETAAVLASSAAMGETVPPSIAMLVLGSVSTLSVGALFTAGLLPAALIALCLMVAIYFRAGRLHIQGTPAVPRREVVRRWVYAIPAFLMPTMLLAGILSGISTPTEVSSFAVIYGVAMAVLVYRKMGASSLLKAVSQSASMTGNILFVVAAASVFSWTLTAAQVPHRLAETLNVFQGQPWLFMLASVFFLVIMGAFLEGLPMILVLGAILLPVVPQFGINPLQYGIVMIIGMGIGLFSPPIGIGIYFACSIAETTMEQTMRPMLFYMAILIIGLLLVAFLPEVSLFLPRLAGLSLQ
ncbi:MAG TPA: TRAP transporter large permease subunit [Chloroflexota bacterium]